ncbi:hypothetical protein J6590_065841 [Homalodisca vitripennis]|nr:hypothetical protein J6590_065841 [Homalodisca vitripennis]
MIAPPTPPSSRASRTARCDLRATRPQDLETSTSDLGYRLICHSQECDNRRFAATFGSVPNVKERLAKTILDKVTPTDFLVPIASLCPVALQLLYGRRLWQHRATPR